MRTILILLIAIHGLIHLFGFLKAFGFSEFDGLQLPLSKTQGLLWLISCILFALTLILLIFNSNHWSHLAFLAIATSQILIFMFWADAKFGTIANIIILIPAVITCAHGIFINKISLERSLQFDRTEILESTIINSEDLTNLPPAVQKWLSQSGTLDKSCISNVYLSQDLEIKLKPDQDDWIQAFAQQYFSIQPPAFIWNIDAKMNPILYFTGRDKFENGKGAMLIKMNSILPIANVSDEDKINEASLQRFLAEMVWFPSAALNSYVKWEHIDSTSARATMNFKGTTGSGIFHYDNNGDFQKFTALRYRDSTHSTPTLWTVMAHEIGKMNGIRIPIRCSASWQVKDSTWTWLRLRISELKYNVQDLPNDLIKQD